MKPIFQLITIAVLPMCGNLPSHGQEAFPPMPASAPAPPPAVNAAPQAQSDAEKQYNATRQAVQQTEQKTWTQLTSAGGGGAGMVYGTVGPRSQDRLQRIIARGSSAGPHPMIIRSTSMEPKDQAGLEEDLAVMAHILNKTIDELPGNRPPTAMGIDVFGAPGLAGIHSMYLDGYGVLFTVNVGLPLLATPAGPAPREKETAVDSTWEEAKQELYGQPPGTLPGEGPVEEFSAEKVNRLADALLDSLKNATNIRGLKPADWVTVCVLGTAAAPGASAKRVAKVTAKPGVVALLGTGGPQGGTVMTVRARKAEIDSFAKGKLTADEFRKEAHVEKYEGGSAPVSATGFGWGGYGGMGGGGGYGTRY